MIFPNLFKSNSTSEPANPMPPDMPDTPEHRALYHADPAVRRDALQHIRDLRVVLHSAQHDPDRDVQAYARTRLCDVLAAPMQDESLELLAPADVPPVAGASPDVTADVSSPAASGSNLIESRGLRQAALDQLTDDECAQLAKNAVEPDTRQAAVARLNDENFLLDIALHDPSAAVRLAAVERIHDRTHLETIAKQFRNRDKSVYRKVQERLDAYQQEALRRQRLEQLCEDVEHLTWDGETGLNAARFPRLDKEWQSLESYADDTLKTRYLAAKNRFLGYRQDSAARRMARKDICTSLEQTLATLRQEPELTEELAAILQTALTEAEQRWQQQGVAEDNEARRLDQQYHELIKAIAEQQQRLQNRHEQAEQHRALCQHAEALLNQPSEVLETDLKELKKRWQELAHPEHEALAAQLQSQFDGLLEQLRQRMQKQLALRDHELEELTHTLDQLEQALDNGELQRAITLNDQARHQLRQAIGLSRKQIAALESRLQNFTPRLNDLRGWKRWGTQQARESLCADAEGLIGSTASPVELAQRIKDLRAAWKKLDTTDGAAPRALWKRFDKACEKAYEPCQVYFEAQTQERQRNLARKQAICEQLEQFEAQTDWERVDWRKADQLQRDAQKQWYKIGPVNRSDKKSLERRFEAAVKRLENRLKEEREREVKRRQDVIRQIQALIDTPDLTQAIEFTKRAQAQWSPTVQASRKEEQTLWHEFRAACDAIFDRRLAEQQAAEQELQAHLAQRIALCEEVESLTQVNSDGIKQALVRLGEIQQQWAAAAPIPRSQQKAIEKRFDEAVKRVERRKHDLEQAKIREEQRNIRLRTQLCTQVERLLWSDEQTHDALVDIKAQWAALTPLKNPQAAALEQRFLKACQSVEEGGSAKTGLQAAAAANVKRKQLLCLRLEVLAKIDSPPEFAKARMEYQVARLTESLTGGALARKSLTEEVRAIQDEWHSMGALPPDQEQVLEARFARALSALKGAS